MASTNSRQKEPDNSEKENRQESEKENRQEESESPLNFKILDLLKIDEKAKKPNFKRLKQILDEEKDHLSNKD